MTIDGMLVSVSVAKRSTLSNTPCRAYSTV